MFTRCAVQSSPAMAFSKPEISVSWIVTLPDCTSTPLVSVPVIRDARITTPGAWITTPPWMSSPLSTWFGVVTVNPSDGESTVPAGTPVLPAPGLAEAGGGGAAGAGAAGGAFAGGAAGRGLGRGVGAGVLGAAVGVGVGVVTGLADGVGESGGETSDGVVVGAEAARTCGLAPGSPRKTTSTQYCDCRQALRRERRRRRSRRRPTRRGRPAAAATGSRPGTPGSRGSGRRSRGRRRRTPCRRSGAPGGSA